MDNFPSETISSITDKMEFYDKYVRIGNEVYIPTEIIDFIFSRYMKPHVVENKKFKAAATMILGTIKLKPKIPVS